MFYTYTANGVLECITCYTDDWGGCTVATATAALRMPEDLAIRYDRLAKSTGRTKTFYMTEALAAEIDRLEYEYGLLKKVEDYRAGRLETVTLDELEESLGLAD